MIDELLVEVGFDLKEYCDWMLLELFGGEQ